MIKLSDYGLFETAEKPAEKRRFQAARHTRQNRGWTSFPQGTNWILRCDLAALRSRARDMAKNSPHFRKFLVMAKSNIIGHKGIQLQCDAAFANGKPYTTLNSRIEDAFWQWGKRETCTESGKLSWVDAQQLAVETLIRDGECLVEHITDADNAFGYALRFWNVDWLDETHNEILKSGNRVIMGVEIDGRDRPVAYWLTEPPSENFYGYEKTQQRRRRRVDARDMSHIFRVTEDESQVRGITWFHAALLQGKDLHEYSGGVVQSARVAAHTFGFLKQTEAPEVSFDGDCPNCNGSGCSRCDSPAMQIDKAPLSVNILDPGFEFQQFDPKQPTQNHAEFMNSMLHTLAAGLGVTGFSLAGDMSQVNFSSARVGLGEEREVWRSLQALIADTLCRDVYRRWLLSALLKGAVEFSIDPYLDQLLEPTWRPRGWSYIEPQKDITAALDAIKGNLLTYREHFAERGIDLEEWLQSKQKEMDLFAQYKIAYDPDAALFGGPMPEPNAAAEDPDEETNAKQQILDKDSGRTARY
jgi:lambda family phage portal protein